MKNIDAATKYARTLREQADMLHTTLSQWEKEIWQNPLNHRNRTVGVSIDQQKGIWLGNINWGVVNPVAYCNDNKEDVVQGVWEELNTAKHNIERVMEIVKSYGNAG